MNLLCKIRDINRSISEFETEFQNRYNLSLNEGMLLCTLKGCRKCSSGEIAEKLALTTSNTSKIISSVEKKGLIRRVLGEHDKRQMYFSLTKEGEICLQQIKCNSIELSPTLAAIIPQ